LLIKVAKAITSGLNYFGDRILFYKLDLALAEVRSEFLVKLDHNWKVGAHGSTLPLFNDLQNFPFHAFDIERLIAMLRMSVNNDRLYNADAIAYLHKPNVPYSEAFNNASDNFFIFA
jgi:hypothetical protein